MRASLLLVACLAQAQDANRLLAEAGGLMRNNRLDLAIQTLNKAATLEPRSATVHLMLGQAYLAKATAEFVAEAKGEFQQARDLDPNQVLPSFYIAKIDLDLGRFVAAERELRRALEIKPREHYLVALLAEARRRQGHPKEAAELATKALEAGPEAAPVYYYRALAHRDLGDDAAALADLNRLLVTPFATPDAHIAAGEIHLRAGRFDAAEAAFRKALALDPARAESHLRLAQALRKLRKFGAALAELKMVETGPQLSSPYFQQLSADAACERGLVLSDQGEAARAKEAFRQAAEIDPERARKCVPAR